MYVVVVVGFVLFVGDVVDLVCVVWCAVVSFGIGFGVGFVCAVVDFVGVYCRKG